MGTLKYGAMCAVFDSSAMESAFELYVNFTEVSIIRYFYFAEKPDIVCRCLYFGIQVSQTQKFLFKLDYSGVWCILLFLRTIE